MVQYCNPGIWEMEEEDQKFRMGLDYFVICLSGLGLRLPKQKQTPTTKSNSNKCILLVIQIAVGALPYKQHGFLPAF